MSKVQPYQPIYVPNVEKKNTVKANSVGQHLFETHNSYTRLAEVFSEGSWSILDVEDSYSGLKIPSALLHKCEEFKNPNQHHIYHSLSHNIRCTECAEQVPMSVETLWRLMNMDMIHKKTYITIFIQSAENKTDKNLGNLYNSKCLKVSC